MTDAEKLKAIRAHAAKHGSAHPAYHKHCHMHPDSKCPACVWLDGLVSILDHP